MTAKRPQDLVFTLFGEYLIHRKSPVWVGSLIALLRPFGVSEGAVRTALSRMTAKRWLATRRQGRNSFYHLTARGLRVIRDGEARIFHPPHEVGWDGRWCLVTYSVPEDVRQLRDRLRVRLSWLGFGPLGNGVWVSPHAVQDKVAELAEEMGVSGNLVCFEARQAGDLDPQALVSRCWNLPALAGRYRDFLRRWEPELDACRARAAAGELREDDAFVLRFRLLNEYRQFPLVDPYLPETLLPERWPGDQATEVFQALHDLLVTPARAYVAAILEREPPIVRGSRTVLA